MCSLASRSSRDVPQGTSVARANCQRRVSNRGARLARLLLGLVMLGIALTITDIPPLPVTAADTHFPLRTPQLRSATLNEAVDSPPDLAGIVAAPEQLPPADHVKSAEPTAKLANKSAAEIPKWCRDPECLLMESNKVPERPEQLPGLVVRHRKYTPEELLALYNDSTIVYTFVNGSDPNHFYRKRMMVECLRKLLRKEEEWFNKSERFYGLSAEAGIVHDDHGTFNVDFEAWMMDRCLPGILRGKRLLTLGDPWRLTRRAAVGAGDFRDRETDELRHSIRSLEQHMAWHRGKLVIVSPAHYPSWIDSAKNFLANSCAGPMVRALGANGSHLRAKVVHQDAIMPYGMKLTRDSNSIEQRLWRVKNLTAVHLYYNDDYFLNRDVKITDVFNEFGGPIVRTEKRLLGAGEHGGSLMTLTVAARHTHLFTIMELDEKPESYLPSSIINMWREVRGITGPVETLPPPNNLRAIDTAFRHRPPPLPPGPMEDRRRRRFVTHSPYVYCTNMFTFLETRYEREFAFNSFYHRARHAQDFHLPFVYNAFMMDRPWVASPKFLPYLLALNTDNGSPNTTEIELNNFDGCGPASFRSSFPHSESIFARHSDDLELNTRRRNRMARLNPLYFNLNCEFRTPEAGKQLYEFIHNKFPTPIYLEQGHEPVNDEDRAMKELYASLMKLPVVLVTSFAEGLCPMVRSLQLALPDHEGDVLGVLAGRGVGDGADKTLSQLRVEMVHRVRNSVPVCTCAYNNRVAWMRSAAPEPKSPVEAMSSGILAGLVDAAVAELEAKESRVGAVSIPTACGMSAETRIRAIVVDGRADVTDAMSLRHAVTMPGQSLALEDFEVVPMGDGSGDSVLVVSRPSADAKAVHWVDGAAESDLLLAYPLAYQPYEDLNAPLKWSNDDGF